MPEAVNPFYGDWGLFQALLAAIVMLATAVFWVMSRDNRSVYRDALEAKQALATLLMSTVVDEARQLLVLIDEHLPKALAQSSRVQPKLSRFDLFCESLRSLSTSQLDDRNKYAGIIKSSFSGILSDYANRLLNVVDHGQIGLFRSLNNPTGLRFELEASTELTLAFVSEKRSRVSRAEVRYEWWHRISRNCFAIAAILLLVLWIPAILISSPLAYLISIGLIAASTLLAAIGLLGVVVFHQTAERIHHQAIQYSKSPDRIITEFENWKTKTHEQKS